MRCLFLRDWGNTKVVKNQVHRKRGWSKKQRLMSVQVDAGGPRSGNVERRPQENLERSQAENRERIQEKYE